MKADDETRYKQQLNGQQHQARLCATADLRLSVLLIVPATATSGGSGGRVGLILGNTRAELAPAHAQRILAITGDGDEGLIALRACQAYVLKVTE